MKHKLFRTTALFLCVIMLSVTFAGCASKEDPQVVYIDAHQMAVVSIEDEAVALAESPAPQSPMLQAEPSGTAVQQNAKAIIDYSNASDGYVMVKYTEATTVKLKARVAGAKNTYTYNIDPQKWVAFPFSEGDGAYTVSVFSNVSGTKYAKVLAHTIDVKLKDPQTPFLYPNQYVDYSVAEKTITKAVELCKGKTTELDKVKAVYEFVVNTLTYDKQKAATVQSGYLPVLDSVLEAKKGICFDYAALMAGMLRSQGVPCRLVVGYAGTAYHAWIDVWTKETGWVDSVVFFDGNTWHRMDPTFVSSGKGSASIMKYIGDGKNYQVKYLY